MRRSITANGLGGGRRRAGGTVSPVEILAADARRRPTVTFGVTMDVDDGPERPYGEAAHRLSAAAFAV